MNERLKQIAIESKLIAPEYNGFDHTRLAISQQKFAELILKECLSYMKDGDIDFVKFMIKRNFGVE